jgi:FkbM family methyltransferase
MSLKRSIADGLERILGVSIAPHDRIGEVYQRDQIRKILDLFSVDCIFDVGANTGQYYRYLRHMVGYDGPVVSYEPTPDLAAELASDAARDDGWHVNSVALDRQAGEAEFHVARDTQFSSLRRPGRAGGELFADGRMEGETVVVRTATLADELRLWRDRIGFARPYLKLDTQGHDLAVAEGGGDALGVFVAIQSEVSIVPIYAGAPDMATALDFFRRRGFDPCAFVPNNDGHFPRLIETDIIFVNRAAAGIATLAAD